MFGPELVQNPGYVGIALQLLDGGMAPLDLARAAIDLQVGAAASSSAVMQNLYTNLFGVPATPQVLQSLVPLLDGGAYTRGSLTLAVAELDLTAQRIDLVGLADSGLEYVLG